MTDRETPSGFFIRAHAVQSFKNDLVHGLNFPTPNPYEGKEGEQYRVAAFVWRTAYNDEQLRAERMKEETNVIEFEEYLNAAGVV